MTEIHFSTGQIIVVDTEFVKMIDIIAEAKKHRSMISVFDATTMKRYGFFAKKVSLICEFKKGE